MLVFYGTSTLLKSFRAQSVNLSTLFPGKPPRQFTNTVSAHSFTSNWQLPFLNQRKGENGRIVFITSLLLRMFAGPEDRIRDRPHTRQTRVRPSYHARQRNLKVGELFMRPSGSMSSVWYSLEAIFESPYEKVQAFRRTILHVINAPDSGVVLTVAVIVKRQTSASYNF